MNKTSSTKKKKTVVTKSWCIYIKSENVRILFASEPSKTAEANIVFISVRQKIFFSDFKLFASFIRFRRQGTHPSLCLSVLPLYRSVCLCVQAFSTTISQNYSSDFRYFFIFNGDLRTDGPNLISIQWSFTNLLVSAIIFLFCSRITQ